MTSLPPTEPTPAAPPRPPLAILEESLFLRRLSIATFGLLLLVLAIYLLDRFLGILQPLFVAIFLGFLMHPVHRWLVKHGIRSIVAYALILALVMLGALAVGSMLYANVAEVAEKLPEYEKSIEHKVRDLAERLPFKIPGLEGHFLRQIHIAPDELVSAARETLGRFGNVTYFAALTFLYLLFLVAEKVSFSRRLSLALGHEQARRMLDVVENINLAIGQYVAVKTLVSLLAGVLSYVVLAFFEVNFAATCGILIFLLNYVPYLGSLIAVSLPVVVSFVQFDEVWISIVVAISLVGIQQVIGTLVEPRLAGRRLDVSPLLIILSLAFWGSVWGIVGMVLAVPLLVIVKIVLSKVPETKPLATLMSNQ